MPHKYKKVIIVGAPRSGTNMLRDTLCKHKDIATWPCDEINYIWKHGNVLHPSDSIPASRASNTIKEYIRESFDWVARSYSAKVVIEKTCANSLRIPFVDKVCHDAKYIFIVRNGMDVVSSSKIRWTASLDWKYILKKARFVPLIDLPYYAARYLLNRIYGVFSSSNKLKSWGPVLDDMSNISNGLSLNEVCALQWRECVNSSKDAFLKINNSRILKIHYEDLVRAPVFEVEKIMDFIQVSTSTEEVLSMTHSISSKNIGKGESSFSKKEAKNIRTIVGDTLKGQGYDY